MSYRVGQRVRVAGRSHDGHHRTPGYVKGKTGRIERAPVSCTNPETRAYGADGKPERALYLVGFAQRDLWGDYRGRGDDTLHLDLFEHWLEEAE
jgi:nitrile hydratase subunit beta